VTTENTNAFRALPYELPEINEDDPPPKFLLKQLRTQTEKLVTDLSMFSGEVLTGETLFTLVNVVCDHIKLPLWKRQAVLYSLQEFQGMTVNTKLLWRIAFKIIGNRDIIKKGMYVSEWGSEDNLHKMDVDVTAEPMKDRKVWTPVHVIDVEKLEVEKPRKPDDKPPEPRMRIKALCMAGPPAGAIITQSMTVKFIRYFLGDLGLPIYEPKSEWETYNMMFMALLGKSSRHVIGILRFHVNSPQKEHNKWLHKNRNDCPKGMPWFCDICPLGSNRCKFAVKKESWEKGMCANGHEGYFRPLKDGSHGQYCVKCSYLKQKE